MLLIPDNSWKVKNLGKIGRGIFATQDIEAGIVIGDYIGKIIPSRDEQKYDTGGHFYLMYYHDRASVYPEDINSVGIHLLNHSCTPNVYMYTYRGHTLFFAIRKIFRGEELLAAYQLGPIAQDCTPCTHQCYCGSAMCTGTMHLTPEQFGKWADFDDKLEKKTVRARIRYNQVLPMLDMYPKSIPDASIYTLFGNREQKPLKLSNTKLPSIKEIRVLIRKSGRTLLLPKLNLHILGIKEGIIISRPIH